MRHVERILALVALLAVGSTSLSQAAALRSESADASRFSLFFEELRIQELQSELSQRYRPETVAFVGVRVLPMESGGDGAAELVDQTVITRDGRIQTIGSRAAVAVPSDARRVEGKGRYLLPGLTDMHVHTLEHSAHMLLKLANGVTSVREMDGFPFLLAQREQVRTNRLLAPNMYVAGHILNGFAMEHYATVITSVAAARDAVASQKKAGYDFIKVHNVLSPPIYDAVAAAAREANLRLVGHIPHDITIAHAIASGQRTFEHFKGYYLDATLVLTDEDYVAATRDAPVWNCPTLYTQRLGLTPAEVESLAKSEEARYVSPRELAQWMKRGESEGASSRKVFELSKEIFEKLLSIHARFLAGTDSGVYPNMVPGFALIEELQLMSELGMPNDEVLRTATANAAEAMERSSEFGTIAVGKRADLVLVERDPRKDVAHLRKPAGVMVRGIWLDRAALDSMLERIATIYRESGKDPTLDAPTDEQITSLVQSMAALAKRGWVFKDHQLDELASLLRARKNEAAADLVLGWKTSRGTGG